MGKAETTEQGLSQALPSNSPRGSIFHAPGAQGEKSSDRVTEAGKGTATACDSPGLGRRSFNLSLDCKAVCVTLQDLGPRVLHTD